MRRLHAILLLPLLVASCDFNDVPSFIPESGSTDYPQEMRDLVIGISVYAHGLDANFLIIPFGGIELVTTDGRTDGTPATDYLNAIDALSQDSVFYGFNGVDQPTPASESERLQSYLDIALDVGNNVVMVTDFAVSHANIDDSYQRNADAGYISFAAENLQLDNIPAYPLEPFNRNRLDIESKFDARNFLILTDTQLYSTPQELVDDISETDYDVVILDFFFNGEPYTADQIRQMHVKRSGGTRLLIAAVDIARAHSDRFYWESFWVSNPPEWLRDPIPGLAGVYSVQYWRRGWQDIIFGDNNSYIYKIINAGFDGAYLEGVEAVDDFE